MVASRTARAAARRRVRGAEPQVGRPGEGLGRQHLHVEIRHRLQHVGHAAALVEVRGGPVLPDLLQGQGVGLGGLDQAVGVQVCLDPGAGRDHAVGERHGLPVAPGHRAREHARLAPREGRRQHDEQRRRVGGEVGRVAGRRAAPQRREAQPEDRLEPQRRLPGAQVAALVVDAAGLLFGQDVALAALQGGERQHSLARRPRLDVEQVERRDHAIARPQGVVEQQAAAGVEPGAVAAPQQLADLGRQGRRAGGPVRTARGAAARSVARRRRSVRTTLDR